MKESIWKKYQVRWDFITELCGNFPLDENIYKKWYEAHWLAKVKPPANKTIQEMQEDVFAALMEAGEALETEDKTGLVGFVKREGICVVGGYTVRAHIKDCARNLSSYYVGKVKGEKSFASKIINCIYIQEDWIPILRQNDSSVDQMVEEPDGIREKPMTVRGPQGQPMSTIKRFFFIEQAIMEFMLLTLPAVKLSDIEKCMEYGSIHGYLGERSQGKGKYIFSIKEVNNGKAK